jgi:1,4-alpha-glucan branching enzyme
MNFLRIFQLWAVAFCLSAKLMQGQIITTDPAFPSTGQPVTITFDATQGNGGLAGYTGDVYAHTGLITEFSGSGSDWKYVKTNWGQNTPDTKMTRIGQDLYTLEIGPSIREYYGAPPSEEILQMAFVFRSSTTVGGQWLEGKTETGGDIFADVFEPGLNIAFILPQQFPVIILPGEEVEVEIVANLSDTVELYFEDLLVKKVAGEYLLDTVTPGSYGKYKVKAVAWNCEGSIADSFYCHVRKPVEIMPVPEGITDGINYTGPNSVTLSLMAPHKEFVYVIGDFNDWDIDSNHYMYLSPDSLRYWMEIGGLETGKEYIFQYFIDGNLRIADPYAEKISDPWNDSYIDDTTYPGLIQYPAGKTTGIASVLQTGQVPYSWEVDNFTPPAITDLVIYEMLVRDFTEAHSYEAVIEKLDYLQGLGVNAVELMPVNEFEGNESWGYNPSFYFAPDKYYGPKEKLKELVDECHKRGIAVIIDLVLNHAYDQCPFVQLYFDGNNPTTENPWFNVQSNFENPDAQWGNDFNHESLYTQQLVDRINAYWMEEYKVDGFRFDFTKGFGNNFKDNETDPWGSNYDAERIALLKRMSDEIWARNPDAIVIMEHLAVNAEEKVLADYGILLWGNMNYNYSEAAMGYHENGKSNFSGISYKQRSWNEPHLVGYMESHDEERVMYKCLQWGNGSGDYQVTDTATALQRIQLNAVFFLTVPGPKMIWQFGEMGYDYSIDFNGRLGPKPVRWDYLEDYRRKYLSDFMGALAKLRVEQQVFETGNFTLNVAAAFKRITLSHPTMNVVVLGNFGVEEGSGQGSFQHTGTWYEYFTGQPFEVTEVNQPVILAPGEYRLYTDIQLQTPQIGTGLEEEDDDETVFRVRPNPSDRFFLEFSLEDKAPASIKVYDLSGSLVAVIAEKTFSSGIHSFSWEPGAISPGIYIIVLRTDDNMAVRKVVLR